MKKASSHRHFSEQLIAQETRITATQLAEHRRKVRQKLVTAQVRERRMRIALGCAFLVTGGMVSIFLALEVLAPRGVWPLEPLLRSLPEGARLWVSGALWVVFVTAAACLVLFTLLYWLRYGRRARQSREEYILLVLSDLQRDVAELQESLRHRPRSGDD